MLSFVSIHFPLQNGNNILPTLSRIATIHRGFIMLTNGMQFALGKQALNGRDLLLSTCFDTESTGFISCTAVIWSHFHLFPLLERTESLAAGDVSYLRWRLGIKKFYPVFCAGTFPMSFRKESLEKMLLPLLARAWKFELSKVTQCYPGNFSPRPPRSVLPFSPPLKAQF